MNTKKLVLIGFFANIAEWYDFSIYVFLGGAIGALFFASQSPVLEILKIFFLFSVSYLIRPIGAIIFGYFADRFGRKKALQWTIILMALPTIGIGLLPVYDSIGMTATFLLILLRLIQGFASGGELPISACYIYEVSSTHKKNFFSSFAAASSMLGTLLGSLSGYCIYTIFTEKEILDYAWRIPFFIGFILFLFILYVRNNIEESKEYQPVHNSVRDVVKTFFSKDKSNVKVVLQIMVVYIFVQSSYYLLFVWLPTYLTTFLGINKSIALASNTTGLFFLVAFTLLVGWFTKNGQHKKMVIFSILSLLFLTYPGFLLFKHGVQYIFMVQIVFAACLACTDGVIWHILSRSFEPSIRGIGMCVAFVFPTAIFGGCLPTLCTYLIYKFQLELIPVAILAVICLIALPVVLKAKTI
ncbi:MAG: MFS transporter [Patescibacteria group bacterium]|jgi:MHS family proline/betaine transporter-like MFS transporter